MATLSKSTFFDPILVNELIDGVKGKSVLAQLCAQEPIPFNGQKEFVFTMGSEAALVAENGAKPAGTVGVTPVIMNPVKIEYGARVSDEFMYAAEEERIQILSSFNDGFMKKAARALDIMAIHGMNPRTAQVSALLTGKYFDYDVQAAYEGSKDANELVEAGIGLVGDREYDVTGIALSPALRTKLAKMTLGTQNKQPMFPELGWGKAPGVINGLPAAVSSTVSFAGSTDLGIVGDFEGAFKWGFAKEIPLKVIEYGCPDNDTEAGDLQGHNQVYIRCELYLGWGILDKNAFALLRSGASGATGATGATGA